MIRYVGTLRIVHFVVPASALRHPGGRRDLSRPWWRDPGSKPGMTCRWGSQGGAQGAVVDDPVRAELYGLCSWSSRRTPGSRGAALVVGSRVGARDDTQAGIPMRACKEPLSMIPYVPNCTDCAFRHPGERRDPGVRLWWWDPGSGPGMTRRRGSRCGRAWSRCRRSSTWERYGLCITSSRRTPGSRGAALVVRSRVGARDDVQLGIPIRARKEPIQENLPPANDELVVNSLFVGIVGVGVVVGVDPHTGVESLQRHHRG